MDISPEGLFPLGTFEGLSSALNEEYILADHVRQEESQSLSHNTTFQNKNSFLVPSSDEELDLKKNVKHEINQKPLVKEVPLLVKKDPLSDDETKLKKCLVIKNEVDQENFDEDLEKKDCKWGKVSIEEELIRFKNPEEDDKKIERINYNAIQNIKEDEMVEELVLDLLPKTKKIMMDLDFLDPPSERKHDQQFPDPSINKELLREYKENFKGSQAVPVNSEKIADCEPRKKRRCGSIAEWLNRSQNTKREASNGFTSSHVSELNQNTNSNDNDFHGNNMDETPISDNNDENMNTSNKSKMVCDNTSLTCVSPTYVLGMENTPHSNVDQTNTNEYNTKSQILQREPREKLDSHNNRRSRRNVTLQKTNVQDHAKQPISRRVVRVSSQNPIKEAKRASKRRAVSGSSSSGMTSIATFLCSKRKGKGPHGSQNDKSTTSDEGLTHVSSSEEVVIDGNTQNSKERDTTLTNINKSDDKLKSNSVCSKYNSSCDCLICRNLRTLIGTKPQRVRLVFVCEHCNETFVSQDTLVRHFSGAHSDVKHFFCKICSKDFKSRCGLSNHNLRHHDPRFSRPRCNKCYVYFDDEAKLKRHIEENHFKVKVDVPETCDICQKSYKNKQGLMEHKLKKHSNNTFICNDCNKVFPHRKALLIHMQTVHLPSTHNCSVCNESFNTAVKLKTHLRKEHGFENKKTFLCELCGKALCNGYALKNHLNWHANIKEYVCTECGKRFGTESNLYSHSYTHSDVRRFSCHLCNKSFRFRHHLQQHMTNHGMVLIPNYSKRPKRRTAVKHSCNETSE